MEESLSLSSRIRELFGLKEVDMKAYSPLTLDYIGDAAYELVIRTMVVEKGNRQASQLHRLTTSYVKAQAQAAMIEALEPELTGKSLPYTKEAGMPSPIPVQRMHPFWITGRRQDWKH